MKAETGSVENLMTLKEVAKFLNIHYETVLDMVENNELPYVIIRKRKRLFKHHLIQYLEKRIIKEKLAA